ncbi:MAG: hypothetical protein HY835_01580 [Anaerolineae bacterium]|nr:hypothetical protein [Anaerolineae bacterium]
MTAGGPLVSLVSGLIGLLVHALWLSGTFWGFASFIFGITSLAIFVVTIFPGKTSGFMTDGAQILSMLRGGEEGEQRALFFILQAESMQGTRPRDYTAAILARLSALKGTPLMNTSAQLIVYYHLLDRGDIQQAEQTLLSLSQHTEELPDVFKKAISLENAFFLAAHRQDATSAQSYLSAAKGALVEKHSMLRAEVAVLWAQGKMDEAQDLARQFDQLASRSIDRGSAIAEREWVQALFR